MANLFDTTLTHSEAAAIASSFAAVSTVAMNGRSATGFALAIGCAP
jgi:hypothetical protein